MRCFWYFGILGGILGLFRARQVGDGMGGGRNGRFGSAPIFGQNPLKESILHKKMQNWGAPKTAVPTTTHPIPHLTPHPSHPPLDALLPLCRKMCNSALVIQNLRKKCCAFAQVLVLFLELAETRLFARFNGFAAVWTLWLESKSTCTTLGGPS